jgi:hypothetical protein
MKAKTPTGIKVIRAVTISIAIVVVLVVGSVVYSGYAEYRSVTSEFKQGQGGVVGETVQGAGAVFSANITIPDQGVYPITATISCGQSESSFNVYCQPASVTVQPGQTGVLRLQIHVQDLTAYENSANRRVNGTLAINMPPFVSLAVATDLSSLIQQGGA